MSGVDALGGNRSYQVQTRGNQRVASSQQPDRPSSALPAAAAGQPRFSIGEWCLNFVKGGVVDTIKSVCSPQGLLMLGIGAALYLNPVTGPFMLAATPFLIGAGVAMGGTKMVTNGIGSLIKAAEGDVQGSYLDAQAAGQGAATMGLSLVGARSFYRGGGAVSVGGRQAYAFGPGNNMGTKQAVKNLFLDMRGKLPRVYNDGTAVVGANGQNMSLFQIARQNAGQAWTNTGQIFARTASTNAGVASVAPEAQGSRVLVGELLDANGKVIGHTTARIAPANTPPQTTALIPYQPSSGSTALVPVNPAPTAGGTSWFESARNFVGGLPGRGRQVANWARTNPNDAIARGGAYGSQLQPDMPSPLDGHQFYG